MLAPAAGFFPEEAAHWEGKDVGKFRHAHIALYHKSGLFPGGLPSSKAICSEQKKSA